MHGQHVSEHIVQLFDTPESLALGVSRFVAEAVEQSAHALVVARPRNWHAIAGHLQQEGRDLDPMHADGRLTVLDAEATLGRFLRDGKPDRRLFDANVGDFVKGLAQKSGAGLRVYGEMVDILADDANFVAAEELENLWNDLGQHASFTLFCGYASSNFASLRGAPALPGICRAHSEVRTTPSDVLGMFLTHGQRSASA